MWVRLPPESPNSGQDWLFYFVRCLRAWILSFNGVAWYNFSMNEEIRVYIDETHHLKSNESPMVLGGLWGADSSIKAFGRKVKVLRVRHNIPTNRELKWTKVSPAKIQYYLDVLKLFLEEDGVNYRAVVIDKELIDNRTFRQTDDDFYYKMQYQVVRHIAERHMGEFRLFFDYKDTWSNYRCRMTADFLNKTRQLSKSRNAIGDHFSSQVVQSYESIPLQVVDLLNGLVAFANSPRSKRSSKAKKRMVEEFRRLAPVKIDESTACAADKVNILFWKPKGQK